MSQDQSASFVLRFTQKLYQDDRGEDSVQWRGKITHVQGNDQANFSEMKDAIVFMQDKLSELTLSSVQDKSEEERQGILDKSLDIWKRMAKNYPKMVVEALKDPKAQVSQIQEQISSKASEIGSKIDIDNLRPPSKSDIHEVLDEIKTLKSMVEHVSTRLDNLEA